MAVRVKAGRERYAARNVRNQGHDVFMPFVEQEGRLRDEPLFPGYIFVLGPEWFYLQSTYGVANVIMMGEDPARMPIKEMKVLLKAANKEGVITVQREKFKKGQQIKVKRGSWQGHVGVYIRGYVNASKIERIKALFKILGSDHELEFDRASITSADGLQGKDFKSAPSVASSPRKTGVG